MKIAFTGKLVSMSRQEAKQKAASVGLMFTRSVAVSILVVGDKPGSRLQKAQKRGAKIINETQFINMVKGRGEQKPTVVNRSRESVAVVAVKSDSTSVTVHTITDVFDDITQDIENLSGKEWLRPAIISHIRQLTKLNAREIIPVVSELWLCLD